MTRGQYERAPDGMHGRPTTPPVNLAREPWREHAACRNHPRWPATTWDDSLAEGLEHSAGRDHRINIAKAVCRVECPVTAQCLRDVDLEWDEGVRGGVDLRLLKRLKGKAS